MNGKDIRVKRTRRKLKEAMSRLLLEREYEELTVLEIARQAGVGQKTFYRHFSDKRGLALSMFEGLLEELFETRVEPESIEDVESNALHFLEWVDRHSAMIAKLRSVVSLEELFRPMEALVRPEVELILSFREEPFDGAAEPPLGLLSRHFLSGLAVLVDWWLEEGKPYPVEQMAEYINRLVVRPFWLG